MCRNIGNKFLSWTYMYTTLKHLGKRVIQTNPSKFVETLFSDIYLCRLRLKQGREIQDFVFWRMEFHSEVYANLNQIRSWPWHVEIIPGVSVVGLVINEELCKLVCGIIINNFMHKYSFIVSCCGRFKIPNAFIFCSVDRERSGRINLPALRCRELNFLSVLRHSHPILLELNRCEVLCERCRRVFWHRCWWYVAVEKEETVVVFWHAFANVFYLGLPSEFVVDNETQ